MPSYLVVARETASSPELVERLGQLEGEHPGSVFSLLVPATPTGQLLASDAGADERVQALGRAAEARAKLQAAGFTVARVEVGDSSPLLAIEGEMRARPGEYDAIVLSTFPPGLSRWLRLDLRRQAARRFDLPVIPVVAQPRPAAGPAPSRSPQGARLRTVRRDDGAARSAAARGDARRERGDTRLHGGPGPGSTPRRHPHLR